MLLGVHGDEVVSSFSVWVLGFEHNEARVAVLGKLRRRAYSQRRDASMQAWLVIPV